MSKKYKNHVKNHKIKIRKIFILAVIITSLKINTYSQGNVSIHFGSSLPVSDFKSDDINNEEAGGAAIGFNLGINYIYPLSNNHFGLIGGIDVNYNGLTKKTKDEVENYFEMNGVYYSDIKFYKYINIPVTFGLNYTFLADQKIVPYVNTGMVLNFLKITNMEVDSYGQIVTSKFDIASNLGLTIGCGILISNKISFSLNYLALGKHDIKGEISSSGYSENIEDKQKVDILTLTIGFRL